MNPSSDNITQPFSPTNPPQCRKLHSRPFSNKLSDIKSELRKRRKLFLGSNISFCQLIKPNGEVDDAIIKTFCHYFAERAVHFWNERPNNADVFCYDFFTVVINSLAYAKLGQESIDDILQLAECLVRSRKVFIIVVKQMLPANMISMLFDFTDSYGDEYYTAAFEDAVLGAISVYLGVLSDPIDADNKNDE